jgi:hypothetical protein
VSDDYDPEADQIGSYYEAIRILRERHLAVKAMEGKSTFTGRIGAHPDDIIAALRNSWRDKPAAVFTRAKRRRNEQMLRMRIDRVVNHEYYSTYNRQFSTRKARRERRLVRRQSNPINYATWCIFLWTGLLTWCILRLLVDVERRQ